MELYVNNKGANKARLNLYGEMYLGDGSKRAFHEGHPPTAAQIGLDRVNNVGLNWSWGSAKPTHIWGSQGDAKESFVYNGAQVKAFIGLSNVNNWSATGSVSDTSDAKYATAGAVQQTYARADSAYNLANGKMTQATADGRYVNTAGDTMTGDLIIDKPVPRLWLRGDANASDSGRLYITEDADHGGWIGYEGSRNVVQYGYRSSGVDGVVFSHPHNSSHVTFQGSVTLNSQAKLNIGTSKLIVNSADVCGVAPDIVRIGDGSVTRRLSLNAKDEVVKVNDSKRVYHEGFKPSAATLGVLPNALGKFTTLHTIHSNHYCKAVLLLCRKSDATTGDGSGRYDISGHLRLVRGGDNSTSTVVDAYISISSAYNASRYSFYTTQNMRGGGLCTFTYGGVEYFGWDITDGTNAQDDDVTFIGHAENVGDFSVIRYQGGATSSTESLVVNAEIHGSIKRITSTSSFVISGEIYENAQRVYSPNNQNISTSVSSTSATTYASSSAVKSAFDLANGKMTQATADGRYLGKTAKAADSDKCDGLHINGSRNDEANKIVRTDGNGYIQAGWINTTSGDGTAHSSNNRFAMFNSTSDMYLRYLTPSQVKHTIGLSNVNNWSATGSVSDTSDTKYATAGAVQQTYARADSAWNLANGKMTQATADGRYPLKTNGTVTNLAAHGIGNDYHKGGIELIGNGSTDTVFPTLGFHQPGTYASSIQLKAAGDFRFYIQGAKTYAAITAANATFDAGVNTTVTIKCDNAGEAVLNLMGDDQGTGRLYVGQSTSHGGGIEYNGDHNPVTTGAGADRIALYRVSGGTKYWTARNLQSDNNWEFRDNISAGGQIIEGSHRVFSPNNRNISTSVSSTSTTTYASSSAVKSAYDRGTAGVNAAASAHARANVAYDRGTAGVNAAASALARANVAYDQGTAGVNAAASAHARANAAYTLADRKMNSWKFVKSGSCSIGVGNSETGIFRGTIYTGLPIRGERSFDASMYSVRLSNIHSLVYSETPDSAWWSARAEVVERQYWNRSEICINVYVMGGSLKSGVGVDRWELYTTI